METMLVFICTTRILIKYILIFVSVLNPGLILVIFQVIQKFQASVEHKMDGHTNRIFSACFHPIMQNHFVSGGWDSTVMFWDLRQEHAIRHLSNTYLCGDGLDIDPDGNELLVCTWTVTDSIKLFDYRSTSLKRVVTPDVYPSQLYCGAFLTNSYILTGGTNSNLFRVANLQTASSLGIVRGLRSAVNCLDIAKKRKIDAHSTLNDLPNILFCSGRNLYEIKFTYYIAVQFIYGGNLQIILCLKCRELGDRYKVIRSS